MFKFIRNKGQQPSAERQKLQRELFAYRKTVQHGFPHKPTCIAWDPELHLMAIATASGAIKVVGQPGVEFSGHLPTPDTAITHLVFIPNEGRLVSLCENNTLHLWEINETSMEDTKTVTLEGKLKKISSLCLDGNSLLLGTEGGNIYCLNTASFTISETVIYQDAVMQNVPEDYKINPGAVECVAAQPGHPGHLLIGYNRGLMVLWDRNSNTAKQTYVWSQQLESISWNASGLSFMSAHNDGSHTTWDVTSAEPRGEPTTPYGPFPCKAITHLAWTQVDGEDLLLYAGGMPRASFSDRHTITAQQGGKHVVFDFTSKVIDFFTVEATGDQKGVKALIVLLEEELVAIDLLSESWSPLQLPYLVSLHASAVTCATYVSDVTQTVYDQIVEAGKAQSKGIYSDAAWPIDGGTKRDDVSHTDLLLTGHEDGSVRVWRGGQVALAPLYQFSSGTVLCVDDEPPPPPEDEEDEWPPFRKVGAFDPYSDDPRLAVKKVCLCPETGVLVIAGTAGHVLTAVLSDTPQTRQVKVTSLNIVGERDKFVWKGHEKLGVRESVECGAGHQVTSVLQLHPPAAVTALALHAGWGLLAVGTAHGLALHDYHRHTPVTFKCTLNPHDLSGVGDAPISRRKSFKKSLRESFRRLRKGRSVRHGEKRGGTNSPATTPTPTERRKDRPTVKVEDPGVESPEAKPVERAVEARPVDDALGSMVRCLTFTRTFIISVQNTTPTLWAGTNNGTVYVFTIAVPGGGNKRADQPVTCQLGKEIQLKHRAPVITVSVIDGECNQVEGYRSADNVAPHRVIITSEEQIKIFTLPSLKPMCKLKLTAGEGARVRRTALARFTTPSQHTETCLLCLTNLGDVIVLSLPELRRQINAAVIRREDINGISSLVFTCYGEALYLHSSSELQRVTVSSARLTTAHCNIPLPDHARAPVRREVTDTSDSSSDRVGETGEIKENGIAEPDLTTNHLDLSSIGDITIDSVKDHLANNIGSEESSRMVTMETTKQETTTESVVVKTTVITTNETTLITPSPTADSPEPVLPSIEGSPYMQEMRKAPLAKMEDLEQLEMAA